MKLFILFYLILVLEVALIYNVHVMGGKPPQWVKIAVKRASNVCFSSKKGLKCYMLDNERLGQIVSPSM